ncbi:SAM-dependent methyltransferase [Mycobacterium sp. IS-1742]|uniref:class I SAM-dependent methyltransferase n=1 Tax=Mycobacterium sp. IS-1742 TaxID=1772285 RepID=UPI00073FE087|nr:class I SAM-dependent methyltransferase [Mycobacterium sp. IS-1742]KUI27545.1 SAM-dependent methyltransferase [Mycobacterium sp. IS-1742]
MRHDNDSWDITTSVGSTALFVAASRALEARKPDPLAVDPYAEAFCRAAGGDWADLFDGARAEAAGDHILHSDFGRHFVDFQGARTKYFDAYFAAASAAGVRQVVLLAAGLDSRAYRLPWPDGTVVYELDQPRVLEFKRAVLAERGEQPVARRREVAIDLRDDWGAALIAAGFDRARPSAWLAEGLLMYLPATAQEALFSGIDALSPPGSWVGVEESIPMPDEVFTVKREEERAAGDDGTFFTLVYNQRHAPAEQWLGERGWAAEPTALADYLSRLGRAAPVDDIEVGPMISAIRLVTATKT